MSKQPEALRLAVDLEGILISEDVHATKARRIAAELRRLHAVNAELLEALELALGAMNYLGDILNNHDMAEPEDEAQTTPAFVAVRAAIAKHKAKAEAAS